VTDSIFEQQRRDSEQRQRDWESALNGGADQRAKELLMTATARQKLARDRRHEATTAEKPKTWAGVFGAMTDEQRRAAFDALEPLVYQGAEPVSKETHSEESYLEPDDYEDFYGDES
jgi:O-acetyl-ADP-ribose deacetylase (regulator of RNase III)